jgi:hypothetical protein
MIDFGQLFRRAWDICWQNRWLFALGILAALGSSGSGANSSFTYSFSGEDLGPAFSQQAEEFFRRLVAAWPALLLGGLLLAVISLLLWLLRLASRGGLIAAVAALDEDMAAPDAPGRGFRAALRAGRQHLGRLIGLDFVLYGPLLVVFLVVLALAGVLVGGAVMTIIADPAAGSVPAGIGEGIFLLVTCLCLIGCLVFFWQIFLAFLHPLAQRSVVLDGNSVFAAIRHGWQILTRNPGDMILLVLLFFVAGIVFRALVAALLVPAALLFFVPGFLDMLRGGFPTGGQIATWIGASLLLALAAQVLGGLFVAYQSAGYTLGYRQLTGQGKAPDTPQEPPPATPYQFEQSPEEPL